MTNRSPKTLQAFSAVEYATAHRFLASRVATMMGRKFEEGDWSYVYCSTKGIPDRGWSNLHIDVMHGSLGVEHKMLCVKSGRSIKEYCGTQLMHPAATRSIRIPSIEGDPTETAQRILQQYAELIVNRRQEVAENAPGEQPDMRTGWLLWQEDLVEFLYFETEMLPPDPDGYWATWHEQKSGSRKPSKNLWVYETDTGIKRYSITTSAGAKIQPYFDVPPPNDPNLYYFRVQGEVVDGEYIRIWVTPTTAALLFSLFGSTDTDRLSAFILERAEEVHLSRQTHSEHIQECELATPIRITRQAYDALRGAFTGASDEHMMQLFAQFCSNWDR